MVRTSANEKRDVNTTMVRTSNEKQVIVGTKSGTDQDYHRSILISTTMVRTANEKQIVVGTKTGTDQDYHGRILKTHLRIEYNGMSEELVDKNHEGITCDPGLRIPRIVGQSNST